MLQIHMEDDAPLREGAWMIAPFALRERIGEEPEVLVYPPLRAEAERFAVLYGDDPFSEDALSYITERLRNCFAEEGYTCDPEENRVYEMHYFLTPGAAVTVTDVRGASSPCELTGRWPAGYETDLEYEPAEDMPQTENRVILGEGKILSVAAVNEQLEDAPEDVAEITVETDEAWRGRGFAKAVTAALTASLLNEGKRVAYVCESDNPASAAVADAVGFSLRGKTYAMFFIRDDAFGDDAHCDDVHCDDAHCDDACGDDRHAHKHDHDADTVKDGETEYGI